MTAKNVTTITQERLREVLDYDPETGVFVWKVQSSSRTMIGSVAGSVSNIGYRYVTIDGGRYLAYRLAFLWMTGEFPPEQVDHKNHARDDNWWKNLRAVTHKGNSHNQSMRATNTSGVTGVYWIKRDRVWSAQITVDGRSILIGSFGDIADASAARKSAEIRHGFHENHGLQIAKQQGSV